MKIESLELKLYFDVFFFFFFFGYLGKIFSRCKAFTANKKWPGRPKSIIFSENSILFLDFSHLLRIFFLLGDAYLALLLFFFFSDSLTKSTI